MNKTPRRQVRVLPPLRGRLAATASPELKRRFSEPLDRSLPKLSKSLPSIPKQDIIPQHEDVASNSEDLLVQPESAPETNVASTPITPVEPRSNLIIWFLLFLLLAIALIVRQQF